MLSRPLANVLYAFRQRGGPHALSTWPPLGANGGTLVDLRHSFSQSEVSNLWYSKFLRSEM
jgi:hypothetical protein